MRTERKKALKEGFRRFRVKSSVFLLAALAALAIVLSLGRKAASGKDSEAIRAFNDWTKENVTVKVKSPKLVSIDPFPGYGKYKCDLFPQMVEFNMLMQDVQYYLDRDHERRKWAYNRECKELDDLLAKPVKNGVDSILIGHGLLRKQWFGRLLDKEVPPAVRMEILDSARASQERIDSVEHVAGLRLVYDVKLDGKPARMCFVSPTGGLDLELESLKFQKR